MQHRLLWLAVLGLGVLYVLGQPYASPPEPSRGIEPASLQGLEERVARLEGLVAESAATTGPETTRTRIDANAGREERIARLEERLRQLEAGTTTEEPPRETDRARIRRLNTAIGKGDLDEIRELLDAGLDVNARDEDRRTPLAAAAIAGRLDTIDRLLSLGADLERTSGRRSMTPLLAALDAVQEEAALALLERGADPEAVDKNGESALIWAAFNGCDRVVERLVAAGLNVDFQAHDGNSALADAARRGHLDIVRLLLAGGANVNSRDKAGRTPLTHAVDAGHDAVVELLRQFGAVR